jgi:hypothetical protein
VNTKVAETVHQTQERNRAEYESKTKGLSFTKDFQTRQEALMHDRMATVGERVMAWILRRSWGEFRLYAVREDGEPAYQRDCVRELRISKKSVSSAVSYFQKRGYLEDRPKMLYPVISPSLSGIPPLKVTYCQDFLQFIEEWKVTYCQDFLEEQVLERRLKEIRKVRFCLYKKSRKAATTKGSILIEEKKQILERETPPPPPPLSLPSPEPEADEEEVEYSQFKKLYPPSRLDDAKAKPAFTNLPEKERKQAIIGLRTHLDSERWTRSLADNDGRFIPLASKFLIERQYAADPPPYISPPGATSPGGDGQESAAAKAYREQQERIKPQPCPTS